jgi:hypothetical protein
MCRRPLDFDIWGHAPGERFCDSCIAERAAPLEKPIRVYMTFCRQDGWQCQFLAEDLKTPLSRMLSFGPDDKVLELIRRGSGMSDSAGKQTIRYAMSAGRGGVYLYLSADQYAKLKEPQR